VSKKKVIQKKKIVSNKQCVENKCVNNKRDEIALVQKASLFLRET